MGFSQNQSSDADTQKNPPISGERQLPPISSESQQLQLLEILFDHGQIKPEYAQGAQVLREIISNSRQQPPITDGLVLIRTLLQEPPYNSPSSFNLLMVKWWKNTAGQDEIKQAQLNNLRSLLAQARPLQTQLRVEAIALDWQTYNTGPIVLSDEVIHRQYHREERVMGPDVIEYVFPARLNPEQQKKLDSCKAAVVRVWQEIREKPIGQRFTIFFVPFKTSQVVSQASMRVDPSTIIAFDDPPEEAIYTAVHEAIHCAIGAEAGFPWSTDFLEGCAERMLLEFGVDEKMAKYATKQNAPLLFSLYKGGQISSSTVALERMAELGYATRKQKDARNQLNYLWGYYLVDSLFDNQKFKQIQAAWQQAGKKKYSLILHINRLYAETYAENQNKKPPLRQRDALAIVFKQKLQFSDSDFEGLLYQIHARAQLDANAA